MICFQLFFFYLVSSSKSEYERFQTEQIKQSIINLLNLLSEIVKWKNIFQSSLITGDSRTCPCRLFHSNIEMVSYCLFLTLLAYSCVIPWKFPILGYQKFLSLESRQGQMLDSSSSSSIIQSDRN